MSSNVLGLMKCQRFNQLRRQEPATGNTSDYQQDDALPALLQRGITVLGYAEIEVQHGQ